MSGNDPASEPAVALVPATGSGVEWIHSLLESADLPTADLGAERSAGTGPAGQSADADDPALYVVRADLGRVGCIGVEGYGDAGLLRSAAIQERHRGEGYGRGAVRTLETEAREAGIEREAVPEAVRGSAEFSHLCPETAVPMYREL